MANAARLIVKLGTSSLASCLRVFPEASFLLPRFEAHNASAIRLHDERTAIWLAVLELVWDLLLEVVDAVELLRLQIPDVEDAGLLLSTNADRNEHLVSLDAGSLPDMVGGEARVEVLDAIVVEGIFWTEMND